MSLRKCNTFLYTNATNWRSVCAWTHNVINHCSVHWGAQWQHECYWHIKMLRLASKFISYLHTYQIVSKSEASPTSLQVASESKIASASSWVITNASITIHNDMALIGKRACLHLGVKSDIMLGRCFRTQAMCTYYVWVCHRGLLLTWYLQKHVLHRGYADSILFYVQELLVYLQLQEKKPNFKR